MAPFLRGISTNHLNPTVFSGKVLPTGGEGRTQDSREHLVSNFRKSGFVTTGPLPGLLSVTSGSVTSRCSSSPFQMADRVTVVHNDMERDTKLTFAIDRIWKDKYNPPGEGGKK